MRGIYTPVVKIRRQIFQKVAQIAYSGEFDRDVYKRQGR